MLFFLLNLPNMPIKPIAAVTFLLMLGFGTVKVAAAPYLPQRDSEILEQLPARPNDPQIRELRELRGQLSRDPKNLTLAIKLAKRYYDQVAAEGDPRYVGYAQAALAPWWELRDPPVEVLVMRANLRQYRHDFDGARSDLARALAKDAGNASAWSMKAAINMVQADYAQALSDCSHFQPLTSELIGAACSAAIEGLNGKARQSHEQLQAMLLKHPEAPNDQKLWVLTRLAEMAQRTGDIALAEAHFRQALKLGITDGFLLAAYADFLLDQNRPAEVVSLLKDRVRSDLLLLRLTLAEKALNASSYAEHRAALSDRFDAARLRGDKVHQQEEARFTLYVLNQPAAALKLAQANWTVQREPRDARVFMEAAIAVNNAAAAAPVLQWLAATRIEDKTLNLLAAKLKGQPS